MLTLPALPSAALDTLVLGNGKPPALPIHLTPSRLRALAARATYADGVASRPHLSVRAPFTGERVASLPEATPADVAEAFRIAREAQLAWAARPFTERARVLIRLHDLVLDRQEEALDLIQLESGKARFHAFEEVVDVALVARYYAYHGEEALAREGRTGFLPLVTQVEVNHVPLGVVGIIAPWNYPLTMAITDALPALLAGNAVVVKPAEQTPFCALWAASLLDEAGLPPGLLHVLPGRGSVLGTPLIAHADFVHFTGSTATGKKVAAQAAGRLVGCSLELGGKNPMLVLADADLDKAIAGAVRGSFASAGQLCVSSERLYVHERLFDDFLAGLVARVEALRVKGGYAYDSDMGSIVSEEQLQKIEAHVADAVALGATLVTGGHRLPEAGPLFYAPTVLTGVTPAMQVFAEETFGPVVSVYPFRTDDEAVRLANDSDFGLQASVWSASALHARHVARRLRCGTVTVNDTYLASWGSTGAPMGGMKQSGLGRRHGPEGIAKYTDVQTVATQHLLPVAPLAGMALGAFAGLTLGALRLIGRVPGLR